MQVMGDIPCIPGLFVAGVFSGALSTVSSGLNSLAAVTLQVCLYLTYGALIIDCYIVGLYHRSMWSKVIRESFHLDDQGFGIGLWHHQLSGGVFGQVLAWCVGGIDLLLLTFACWS